MADVPIRVFNPDGTPNTTLTKTNVNFKTYSNGTWGSYISYYDLWKTNNLGNYVAQGITGWQECGLYIDDVYQYWWGVNWIGDPKDAFVGKIGNESISGTKDFADETKLKSISEHTSGAGISACHKIISSITPTSNYELINKAYVDTKTSATGTYAVLTGNNTFTGINTFSTATNFNAGLSADGLGVFTQGLYVYGGGLTSNFFHPVKFNMYVPSCQLSPTQNYHLTNRGWVVSEIITRLNTMGSGLTYQESQNIIRLIIDGTTTGSVYAAWNEAATYLNANATSSRNITMQIPGNGTTYNHIGMSNQLNDYIHIKATGEGVVIYPMSSLSAGAVGRKIYEGFEFYFNDSENPFDHTNMYYKNMILNCVQADGNPTYYGCHFESGVIFKGISPVFVNCTQDGIVYSENTPIISSGTLRYETPLTLGVGTQILKDNGTAIETHSLSGTGTFSTTSMNIGGTSLTGNGTELYVGGMLKTNSNAYIGGETNINGRLNATGDVTFISNRITEKATDTISLSANTISLSGALNWNQIPTNNQIELVLGDGNTYLINVQQK